ncbi:MAG: hypothetical protein AAF710_04260 [Planctomycetota bacterium]
MMTTPRFRLAVTVGGLLALTLAAALPGCNDGGQGPFPTYAYSDDGDLLPRPSGGGLVVDPDSEIPDVPRPVGFVGVPSKSTSSVDPLTGIRTVFHVYQGRSNTLDAAAYFRRNLDDFGWSLDGFDQGDPRSTVQSYAKGPEQLRINITGDRAITTLTVAINPRDAVPQTGPVPGIDPAPGDEIEPLPADDASL